MTQARVPNTLWRQQVVAAIQGAPIWPPPLDTDDPDGLNFSRYSRWSYAFKTTDANTRGGLSVSLVQDAAAFSFPAAVGLHAILKGRAVGNAAFALFARADQYVPGGISNELNTFNFCKNPPTAWPPGGQFGTQEAWQSTLVLGAGGDYPNHVAMVIGSEGHKPQPYLYGIGFKAGETLICPIVVAATATLGPLTSALLQNTGATGNIHLRLQTTGAGNPNAPVVQHVNAAGQETWRITFDGRLIRAGA